MSVSPARSLSGLDLSLTIARGARVEYRALSGSPEMQMCLSPAGHSLKISFEIFSLNLNEALEISRILSLVPKN